MQSQAAAQKHYSHDPKPSNPQFLLDVINGLSKPTKTLQPKYFYDTQGSIYFDQICDLPEYYPYRTELTLLPQVAKQLDSIIKGCEAVIEFGAGSLRKIQFLLDHMAQLSTFIPIDIAEDFLRDQCMQLRDIYPHIHIHPIAGDFCQPLPLPNIQNKHTMGFFPGSTIGNFSPSDAKTFLSNAGKTLGQNNYLLIGVDTKKSARTLHQAYNDSQNITAKFNLNILKRINSELGANFNLTQFEHYAFYNAVEGRIEMHLISSCHQSVNIGSHEFQFTQGEPIHTECSYKYTPDEFISLAQSAGWTNRKTWLAHEGLFSLFLLQKSA